MAACNVCGSTRSKKADGVPVVCVNGAACADRAHISKLVGEQVAEAGENRDAPERLRVPDPVIPFVTADELVTIAFEEQPAVSAAYQGGATGAEIRKAHGPKARLTFRPLDTTRLVQIDLNDTDAYDGHVVGRIKGAFVKVTAELRPSEREAFDGQALKDKLRELGARAVLLAVVPVAEAPDKEAKADVVTALRPEDAIAAWFDGLNNVPEEDREAAKTRALEILAAEGL